MLFQNYTETGFKKVRAPADVFKLLKDYWDDNHDRKMKEEWYTGNTYVNHWAANTFMTNVESTSLPGGGQALKQKIWDGVKPLLEEWTGMELVRSSNILAWLLVVLLMHF